MIVSATTPACRSENTPAFPHDLGSPVCRYAQEQIERNLAALVQMADGTTFDAQPGDVTSLPSGHDAWVVGDEQVVLVDWFGASQYAK
jgi:hypothetical protein